MTDISAIDTESLKEMKQVLSDLEAGKLEIWSCDPSEILPWTPEELKALEVALSNVFGLTFEKKDDKN